jgi:DNA-binding transcriptional LysR family regulator
MPRLRKRRIIPRSHFGITEMRLPITLRQLEIFGEVARRGSLAGAARALRLGEPTISESVRELEQRLGCTLFDRSARRLKLSSAGQAFQADASRLVTDAESLLSRYSGYEHLTIGASVTVGNYILPELLVAMGKAEPRLVITVVVRNSEAITQALLHREIEVAVIEGQVTHPELVATPWRFDDQVIVGTAGHPLAEATHIAALALERWVLREPGSGTRETFDAAAASWPFRPIVAMTLGGNELLKRAVASGVGLGCLSWVAVREEVARGELVSIRPQGIVMRRTLRILRPRSRASQPALQRFLSLCDVWQMGSSRR